ncbi:hypothetical protein HDR58_05695, partial [bacterium]|nr:hypothetical protein [bacterium]
GSDAIFIDSKSPATFGDLTMNFSASGDRLYTNTTGVPNYGSYSYAQRTYSDGYVSAGGWYCNGQGGSTRRYVTIANVHAGDKIVAYMGITQTSDSQFFFERQGTGAVQKDSVDAKIGAFEKYEFVAQYDGTYKIYENNLGKPMYHRFKRVPGVAVSGTIDLNRNNITGYGLKFVNLTTKTETVATVAEDGSFTATLGAGYTYRAVMTGVAGYGFTAESSNNIRTTDAESLTGKTGVDLVVETKDTYLYSGKIKGFDSNYGKLSNLKITMTPPKDSDSNEVELNIDTGKMEFSADLEPDVEYSLVMEGVNDYEISAPTVVVKENENTSYENRTITVALRPKYEVAGGFIGLDGTTVTSLTFTNTADNYAYMATIEDDGYSIQLRDGEYLVTATVSNYSTKTHVVVNGGAVSRDILFVSTAAKNKIPAKSDIYVGYPNKADNYATVSEAVEAAELMDRTADEEHRVTIHIAPGTYREQIIINAPYISFVNDEPDEEVLLTWYYGIGYKYYSTASSKFYDAEDAYDKYDKNIADRWGCSVRVQSAATAFRAEGITFESSFNRYITDEELIDGVEVSGTESIRFVRAYGADVQSKDATERATALVVEADKAEFKNCGFYSSQDTLYTQGAHIYFKNCVIEGQTDYIFGSGNCIFDACELSWKGYSTGSSAGYITANRPVSGDEGYLFRNCTITANSYNNLTVTPGYFGRPWGGDAKVAFVNTKLQNLSVLDAAGWYKMNGEPKDANYKEYNTTSLDGKAVVTTSRQYAVIDEDAANALTLSKYFGTWKPEYYTAPNTTGAVSISGGLTISDNGDSNVPKPGHTLTVNYSLGDDDEDDVSAINWYIVEYNEDGTEKTTTLVKSSTAIVDKTYKITKDAVGKYIKVTVTPETLDGRTGTAVSATTYDWSSGGKKCPVLDGYEDPSSGSGGITLGEGVNIFLAGDSTVKDYSAAGMYNGGKAQDLGSWGEFLQSFFNESEVKIQNYANGGRSTRNFINEGSLKKIENAIGEGDYLFIQFGHNDSSNSNEDRYVPVGTPTNGIYPTDPGTLVDGKYPDYTSGGVANSAATGTYKWFLQQYIDVAVSKGAIPVIVSPVARQYYNDSGDGKIKPHHDDNTSSNNAYVTAAYQIYEDNKDDGCLWIDGFTLTKDLFEAAYEADPDASGKTSNYGLQVMGSGGDSTHNNKLGGMIEAMAIASAIQNLNKNISYAVKAPSQVRGATTDGATVFSIDGSSKLTAYDILSDYAKSAPYWEKIGQEMITAISAKAGELADSNIGDDVTAAPKAEAVTEEDDDGKLTITVTLTCDTAGNTIYYTTDGSDPKKNEDKETYENPIVITEDTTLRAYATATGKKDSKGVTFEYSVTPIVDKPTASEDDGARIPAGTVITLSAAEGAVIRYTQGNNPEDPTIYSRKYSNGITVSADTTIKAIAVKGGVKSEVAVFKYTVYTDTSSITVNKPTFNPAPTEENVALNTKVTLEAEDGAVIYYTQGKSPEDPTTGNADIYDDEGIIINKTTTIKAIAVKSGKASEIASATYKVQTVKAPEATPAEGIIDGAISVTLESDEDATIWYTTDRKDPRTSDSRSEYKNPIPISETTTIKAYAEKEGYADSDVVTLTYTMKGDVPVGFSTDPYFNITTPHPTNTLEVKYELDTEGDDISTIKWYVGTEEITANADSHTYVVKEEDIGEVIKAIVTPKVEGAKAGTAKEAVSEAVSAGLGKGSGLELILATTEYTYTGSAIIPEYSVTYDGVPLVEGIDYTVKFSNNVKVSTDKSKAKITVTGKGNLSGNTFENFNITKKSLDKEDTEGAGAVQGDKVVVVANSKASPVLIYNGIKLGTKDYEFVKAADKSKKWKAGETGTIEIKAKANGNFTGNRTLDVVVVAKNNDSKLVVNLDSKANKDLYYNGGVVHPKYEVTNKKGAKDLVENEDYIISFPDEEVSSAGKKTFTVIGTSENCVGTVTKSYTVKPALKTGTFKVELNGTDIIKNKQEVDFVSTGAVLDTKNIKVTYVVKAATETEQAVERTLTLGSDYKITYSGNKKVTDNAKFTITGQGNYKGVKLSGTYKIKAATLSLDTEGAAGTVEVIVSDKIYTSPKMYKSTPCVIEKASGTVLKSSNYKVEYFDDNNGQPSTTKMTKATAAGKVVWVKITGKGGYTGDVSAKYTVKQGDPKKDLSTATISFYETSKDTKAVKAMKYTGEEVVPYKVVIKLKDKKEITLTLDKDADGYITSDNKDKFDIEFFNNIEKGKASVVITSKDDATCIGAKTVNFSISAKTLKGFEWVK